MNKDLVRERRQTTFNVEELSVFLFGGKENLDAIKYLGQCKIVLNSAITI